MSSFESFLAGVNGPVYSIFRSVSGLLFMAHGTQKLFEFPSEFAYSLNPMSMAAGGIELVGGFLIAIGFLTRPAFLSRGHTRKNTAFNGNNITGLGLAILSDIPICE